MKIAVVGSRNFNDISCIDSVLDGLFETDNQLISGGAKGVDSYAYMYVKNLHFYKNEPKVYLPAWDRFGKRAGAIRNKQIVDAADCVIVFWDGESKGIKITIDMAIKKGIPVDIYIRK